ncbi:MAG TPA: heavy metal sensor histidine kinase [Terriglobales bacterium]|jgi:heavy metal sensor kinase
MMSRFSIRARLTMWYALCLAAALVLFTAAAILLMRRSIYITVDEQLADEMNAVQNLIRTTATSDLPNQVRTHEELQAGSSLLQVANERGDFLYRSPRLRELAVPMPLAGSRKFAIAWFGKSPLRVYAKSTSEQGHTFTILVAQDMDDYFEATARYELFMLIGIPLLLSIAALVGYWISRRALAPVDHITRAAQNISPNDLTGRLTLPGTGDELERLAETLNSMLQRIEGAFQRITHFTADASHELRTPVALIRTRAEISLRKSRNDQEYREALQEILHEAERMSVLIENLMLLARADLGAQCLTLERTDLCEIAQRASVRGKILADTRELRWSQTIPDSPLWIKADSESVGRLFLILIDNAVKYTPVRGSVAFQITKSNGNVHVDVNDTGIGIAERDLPHVFERFYRADTARSRDSGGAGLGLAIGQWIVNAHQGQITVESAVQGGSRFRVSFPLIN